MYCGRGVDLRHTRAFERMCTDYLVSHFLSADLPASLDPRDRRLLAAANGALGRTLAGVPGVISKVLCTKQLHTKVLI